MIFSCIPSVAVRDMEWARKTQVVNKWQTGWCCHRIFGFFDHGAIYLAPGLMAAEGLMAALVSKREMDPGPRASGAHQEGYKLGRKGEGDAMRITRVEPVVWDFILDPVEEESQVQQC